MHDTSSQVITPEVDRDYEILAARRYLVDSPQRETYYYRHTIGVPLLDYRISCVQGENCGRIAVGNVREVA
jgi:hypothetical protein